MRFFPLTLLLACNGTTDDASSDTGELSVANQGPNGTATAENGCGPVDEYMLRIDVNVDGETCEAEADPEWNVQLQLLSRPESGQTYTLNDDLWVGRFNHLEEEISSQAELTLDFEGEWVDGIVFTGHYILQGDFPLIEGHFSGQYCTVPVECG